MQPLEGFYIVTSLKRNTQRINKMTISTQQLAEQAAKIIEGYKTNPVIMDFVTKEAHEKTASDIREKTGSGTTAKAVELLYITNEKVKSRVDDYINSALVGCYLASLKA